MVTQISLLREDLAKTIVAKNTAPGLTASQLNTSIADALERTVQAKQTNPTKADLSNVPPQFSDILNYSSKPPVNRSLSDEKVRNLARAYANLQNINNTLAKLSALSSTGIPSFVVAPLTITVLCCHMFGQEFINNANDILMRESRVLSDLVSGRFQTLHDTI